MGLLKPMLAAKSREELAGFPGKSRALVDRLLDQRDTAARLPVP
jgi:hypothetical protein